MAKSFVSGGFQSGEGGKEKQKEVSWKEKKKLTDSENSVHVVHGLSSHISEFLDFVGHVLDLIVS